MKNVSQSSRNAYAVLHRGVPAVLTLLFLIVSVWKWNVISSSIASLVLTPIVVFVTQEEIVRYVRFDVVEYWLAAIVWIVSLILLVRWFFRLFFTKKTLRLHSEDSTGEKFFFDLRKLDIRLIILYVIVALSAPILAPLDPSSHGDLRTTRLLKPFQKGIISESVVEAHDDNLSSTSSGSVEGMLKSVNNYLVLRDHYVPQSDHIENKENVINHHAMTFLLGTDNLGRDVLSRLIYGLRLSLVIGVAAVLCTVILGCVIGLTAGIAGGWIDHALMRFTDLFLAVPSLFFVIALVALFGNTILLLILVLAGTGWMSVARLVRGEVVLLREREFIVAARLLGRSQLQILRDHVLPNVLPIIVVASVLQLSNVVLAEAALSFLGLGIQPPTPSLGNMIGESLPHMSSAWWVGVFPGIALSSFVVLVNMAADHLQKDAGSLHD